VAAALKHHLIDKDGLLRRMWWRGADRKVLLNR
jgi:cytochrome b561